MHLADRQTTGRTTTLDAYKAKAFADPAVRDAYDTLAPEFDQARAVIEDRAGGLVSCPDPSAAL